MLLVSSMYLRWVGMVWSSEELKVDFGLLLLLLQKMDAVVEDRVAAGRLVAVAACLYSMVGRRLAW